MVGSKHRLKNSIVRSSLLATSKMNDQMFLVMPLVDNAAFVDGAACLAGMHSLCGVCSFVGGACFAALPLRCDENERSEASRDVACYLHWLREVGMADCAA